MSRRRRVRSRRAVLALRTLVIHSDRVKLSTCGGRSRSLECRELHREAHIVARHPRLSVLDRALDFHASRRKAGQRRARRRRDVLHGEIFASFELGTDALPPLARLVATIAIDENLPRSAARLANQFFI